VADDDVTDLTDDGAGAPPASKSTPKKAPAPKAPKAPSGKSEKASKEKDDKKSGTGGIILIMILILILLIGGFAATLFLDLFNSRQIVGNVVNDPLIGVIVWLDPKFSTIEEQLEADNEAQETLHAQRSADLDAREENIELIESELQMREQLLDRRAMELDGREIQIIAMYERTIPLHRREMTEEEHGDMLALSRTYSQMSPADAARILVQLYDPRDVAAILYYMNERNAGSILTEMDARYAAEITEILLYS